MQAGTISRNVALRYFRNQAVYAVIFHKKQENKQCGYVVRFNIWIGRMCCSLRLIILPHTF